MSPSSASLARATYDAFAPFYDQFNGRYKFRQWTARLLAAAEEAGLRPGPDRRLLDVACGTGLSGIPMVERGWSVTACDISPRMIEEAEAKQIFGIKFCQADMRSLPQFGRSDLAWAVNDAMNYLLSIDELASTISGMGRNLASNGLLVFDVNTSATYAEFFDRRHVVPSPDGPMIWRGRSSPADPQIHEAEVSGPDGVSHIHRQRHFTEAEVIDAIHRADLDLLAVKGEIDGNLVDGLEEGVHTKAVYVGRSAR